MNTSVEGHRRAATPQEIEQSLQIIAQEAWNAIGHAVEDVARAFLACGGYGSLRMHLESNRTIVGAFGSGAGHMAAEARRCERPRIARNLLELHLAKIIDRTLTVRAAQLRAGNAAIGECELLCAELQRNLKRIKDAAIRGVN